MAYKALETTVTDFEADVAALSNICVVSVVPGASAGDLVVIYEQRYPKSHKYKIFVNGEGVWIPVTLGIHTPSPFTKILYL